MNDDYDEYRSGKTHGAQTMYELLLNAAKRFRIIGKSSEADAIVTAANEAAALLGLSPSKDGAA